MLIFDVITIFPNVFDSYLREGLISRAQKKELINIRFHNLRDWADDNRRTIDDKPFGGGSGMVMKVEPIYKAVTDILKKNNKKLRSRIILFTPRGKEFNQKIAYRLSKIDQIILICGRYDGIDERVAKYIADEQISIGDYDLMGGELPAMVLIEVVSRLVPGVIGKPGLLGERIPTIRGRGGRGFIEYPQYTRPNVFRPEDISDGKVLIPKARKADVWHVPRVLLSGHHQRIKEWRIKHQKVIEK